MITLLDYVMVPPQHTFTREAQLAVLLTLGEQHVLSKNEAKVRQGNADRISNKAQTYLLTFLHTINRSTSER